MLSLLLLLLSISNAIGNRTIFSLPVYERQYLLQCYHPKYLKFASSRQAT